MRAKERSTPGLGEIFDILLVSTVRRSQPSRSPSATPTICRRPLADIFSPNPTSKTRRGVAPVPFPGSLSFEVRSRLVVMPVGRCARLTSARVPGAPPGTQVQQPPLLGTHSPVGGLPPSSISPSRTSKREPFPDDEHHSGVCTVRAEEEARRLTPRGRLIPSRRSPPATIPSWKRSSTAAARGM